MRTGCANNVHNKCTLHDFLHPQNTAILCSACTGKEDDDDHGSEYSDNDRESSNEDNDAVDVHLPRLVVGQRVQLRHGAQKTFAATTILDAEPKPAPSFPGVRGDYVLVRGGLVKISGNTKKSAMQVVTGWETTDLFIKPKAPKKSKAVPYHAYPGILKPDWSLFEEDMTPGDLMKRGTYLIDRQHTWVKPTAVKNGTWVKQK